MEDIINAIDFVHTAVYKIQNELFPKGMIFLYVKNL